MKSCYEKEIFILNHQHLKSVATDNTDVIQSYVRNKCLGRCIYMAKRFYAVRKGRKTGVFSESWNEVQRKYIKGFSNPEVRGFDDIAEAEKYLRQNKRTNKKKVTIKSTDSQVHSIKMQGDKQQHVEKEQRMIKNEIIYHPEIEDHLILITVTIAVSGHQKKLDKAKPGFYRYVMIHDKSGKIAKSISTEKPETSPSQAIIFGLMDAIVKLRRPCHIKLYTKANIGIKKMIRGSKSPNHELLKELKELILEKGHVIEEIVDIEKTNEIFEKAKDIS